MKRMIWLTLLASAILSTNVTAENLAPSRQLNALDALGINLRSEITGAYMVSLEKNEAMTLSQEQINTFFNAADTITLERRLVKNPFSGICIVLETVNGEKAYYLNSGVQYGKYGEDNYLCYSTAEENELLDSLYVNFMSEESKYYSDNVVINSTDYFIYPMYQWAVDDAIYSASKSLLPYEITEHFGELISRENFCILIGNFISVHENYADLSGYLKDRDMAYLSNYFDDIDGCDDSINMLHALGIINGVSDSEFAPGDPLTREQAAVIMKKTADLLGISGDIKDVSFEDKNNISGWAAEAVKFVSTNGIMSDTNGYFNPLEYLTTEQAIAGVNKLYKLSEGN